jgi:hypothetical protein
VTSSSLPPKGKQFRSICTYIVKKKKQFLSGARELPQTIFAAANFCFSGFTPLRGTFGTAEIDYFHRISDRNQTVFRPSSAFNQCPGGVDFY